MKKLIFVSFILFQMLNYSITFAGLNDLNIGIWSTILTIAFCSIDFSIIAIYFSDKNSDFNSEKFYLFGAIILTYGLNATIHWWATMVYSQDVVLSIILPICLFFVHTSISALIIATNNFSSHYFSQ